MGAMHFEVAIDATRERVWQVMLADETYRHWTAAFSEGSYYVGDWSAGSRILFLAPDPATGREGGMVARIADSRLHEYVSIQHLGTIEDGEEHLDSSWTNAFENYALEEDDGATRLTVSLTHVPDEYTGMMGDLWPKALQVLKDICEHSQ